MTVNEIANVMNRTLGSVQQKLHIELPRRGITDDMGSQPRGPAAQLLDERDARIRAAQLRTQTQEFFGDPPPGYSALDKKRTGATG